MKSNDSEIEQEREVPDELTTLKHCVSELEALRKRDLANQPTKSQRWISNFAAARSIVTSVLVLVVIVAVIWSATLDLLSQVWRVQPIQVPAQLVEQGLQPAVVAQHLMDELKAIQEASSRSARRENQLPLFIGSERKNDIQVPGIGFSLSSVLDYVRPIIGVAPVEISGEILKNGDKLRLRIRIISQHGETIEIESKSENGILELLNPAARRLMKELDPLTLARYLLKEDPKQVLPAVTACFHNDSPDDDAPALVVWGQLLLDRKEYDAARAKADEALQLDSKLSTAYSLRGDVHYEKGEYESALEPYQKAFDLNSKYAYAVNQLGLIYLKQDKFADAEEQYRKAVDLLPKESITHNNLGEALRLQKRYNEAIESYKAAIRLDPENFMPYTNWGILHMDKNQFDEAIVYFEKATEIEPLNPLLTLYHGQTLAEIDKLQEAKERYRRALEVNPNMTKVKDALRKLEN